MNIETSSTFLNLIASFASILLTLLQIRLIFKEAKHKKALSTTNNEINININLKQQNELIINNPSTITTYNSSNENFKIFTFIVSLVLLGIVYFTYFDFVFFTLVAFYIPISIYQTRKFLLILKVYNTKLNQTHLIRFVSEKVFLLLIILSVAYIPFDMKQFVTPMFPPDDTFKHFSTIIDWLVSVFSYLFKHLIEYDYQAYYYIFRAGGIILLLILTVQTTRLKATVLHLNEKKKYNSDFLSYFLTIIFLHSHLIYPFVESFFRFS